MAKRVRKTYKERQKELDTPEVVEETLWSLSDWMEANWRPVVMGIGVIVILMGGAGIYQMIGESSAESAAAETAGVFSALNMPVYVKPAEVTGDDPNKPLGATFESDKARAAAVLAASANASGDDGVLIGALAGAAAGANGDHATQLAKLDAAITASGSSALALAFEEQKAGVLTAMGKSAEAAASWKKVADGAKASFARAHALIRIGDLNNVRTGAKATNVDVAKGSYTKAIAALTTEGKAPSRGALAFLHAEATTKLASL